MRVVLLSHTPNAETVVAVAARQCYDVGFSPDKAYNMDNTEKLIRKVIGCGHTSVLEHASFTFGIEGISRVTSHQLVRYRIASFSQQSQRYTTNLEKFIIPKTWTFSHTFKFEKLMVELLDLYAEMIDYGTPKEDARYILPNASTTNIIMTMNARELIHAINMRTCLRAQWEIRELFEEVLAIVKKKAPTIFEKVGRPYMCEKCPEGDMSCKRNGE